MMSQRADGSIDLDLAGFMVMRCSVDFAFTLDLARPEQTVRGQRHASVIIEAPFELVADGATLRLDPETPRERLGPALALFGRAVEEASVAQDGTLHLRFGGEMALRVPSLPRYEAWEMLYGRGGRLICMPGGELAIWSEIADDAGDPGRGASGS